MHYLALGNPGRCFLIVSFQSLLDMLYLVSGEIQVFSWYVASAWFDGKQQKLFNPYTQSIYSKYLALGLLQQRLGAPGMCYQLGHKSYGLKPVSVLSVDGWPQIVTSPQFQTVSDLFQTFVGTSLGIWKNLVFLCAGSWMWCGLFEVTHSGASGSVVDMSAGSNLQTISKHHPCIWPLDFQGVTKALGIPGRAVAVLFYLLNIQQSDIARVCFWHATFYTQLMWFFCPS